jgi:hypothetical protein
MEDSKVATKLIQRNNRTISVVPESAPKIVFAIAEQSDALLKQSHEPCNVAELPANFSDAMWIGTQSRNLALRGFNGPQPEWPKSGTDAEPPPGNLSVRKLFDPLRMCLQSQPDGVLQNSVGMHGDTE